MEMRKHHFIFPATDHCRYILIRRKLKCELGGAQLCVPRGHTTNPPGIANSGFPNNDAVCRNVYLFSTLNCQISLHKMVDSYGGASQDKIIRGIRREVIYCWISANCNMGKQI